jgi:hypothetical protein
MARSIRAAATAVENRLLAGLQRLHPGRPIVRTEYPVDPRPRWGWGLPPHPELEALIDANAGQYIRALEQLREMTAWAETIPRTPQGTTPGWVNDYWGGLDALVQCRLLRDRSPATYLEVGSGFSTMFARRAVRDFELPTKIVSVDPSPRAEIDVLCDEVVRRPLEDVADDVLARVAPGDVVVFDGSHYGWMNSDAVVMLLELMPRFPSDVVVAIDDIVLPWDYHPTWRHRFYGEQYIVAAMLLGGGGGFRVLMPDFHISTSPRYGSALEPLRPFLTDAATTMWLQR